MWYKQLKHHYYPTFYHSVKQPSCRASAGRTTSSPGFAPRLSTALQLPVRKHKENFWGEVGLGRESPFSNRSYQLCG